MAEQQRRGAFVGLAAAASLLVLIASGVAVNRLATDDPARDRPRLAGPTNEAPGSATSPGAAVAGAELAPPPVDASADTLSSGPSTTAPAPAVGAAARRIGRAVQAPDGTPDRASAAGAPAAGAPTAGSDGSDGSGGSHGSHGSEAATGPSGSSGSSGSGDPEPPPSGEPAPESAPLVAASVSAGQGDRGGVVGVGLDENPDADVTVGTTHVVGDAPPSHGTGVGLGGQLLHPPPTIPILPG